MVAAFRNRKLSLSENADELYESKEEATLAPKLSHTNQFRLCFYSKAISISYLAAILQVRPDANELPMLTTGVVKKSNKLDFSVFSVGWTKLQYTAQKAQHHGHSVQ